MKFVGSSTSVGVVVCGRVNGGGTGKENRSNDLICS